MTDKEKRVAELVIQLMKTLDNSALLFFDKREFLKFAEQVYNYWQGLYFESYVRSLNRRWPDDQAN